MKTIGKILLLVPFLFSCAKAENNIYALKNYDINDSSSNFLVEIGASKIISLINSSSDFSLLIYSTTCQSCEKVIPLVNNYIKENKVNINSFNVLKIEEFNLLKSTFPNIFYDAMLTPTFYVFKNGKQNLINNEQLYSQDTLNRMLNQYYIKTEVGTCTTLEGFNNFINSFSEYMFMSYNGTLTNYYDLYSSFKTKAINSKKGTLLIDYTIANSSLTNKITELIGSYQNIAKIKNETYSLDNKETFITAVNNFYN